MKNPANNLRYMAQTWLNLRQYPGLFSLADASLQLGNVLLPERFHFKAAGRALQRETDIQPVADDCFRVRLIRHGLSFFWPAQPTNHVYYFIDQEINPRNPHHYTTPPIRLTPESLILDVGACEGLFAFRVLKLGLARQVICFEPGPQMAKLLQRGADENGVGDRLAVEAKAVTKASGRVMFSTDLGAEANRIQGDQQSQAATEVGAVCLDDYCRLNKISLGKSDLIKIDAEGMDLDVLQGAEQTIRSNSPQIAVTTYHKTGHCFEIVQCLKQIQPAYRMRLKGFSFWTPTPQPVLLQASSI